MIMFLCSAFCYFRVERLRGEMSKYGLQLRVKPTQQKKVPPKPPLPTPLGFQDDDEDDVEREISRHASKKKALKDVSDLCRNQYFMAFQFLIISDFILFCQD